MNSKVQNRMFDIISVFFICYFMQIFNFPSELMVVLGGVLCAIAVFQQKKLRIDIGVCMLMLTTVSYFVIINGVRALAYSAVYIPIIIHVLGNYATHFKGKNNQMIRILLLMLVIGYTVHGILNSYMYYAGHVIPGTRRWADFWSRGIVPGTQHAIYFLPLMALFAPIFLCFKERKVSDILVILITAFFGYTSLVTRSRMTVLIFAIVIFAQILVFAFLEKEKMKMILQNKKIWIICAVALFVMAGAFFAIKDTKVMVAFIDNMSKDGGILNNIRFVAQRQALQQLFKFPMGGKQMEMALGNYCHNTWLDMANAAGLIPFFAFVGYTVYSFYKLLVFLVRSHVTTKLKLGVVGIYVAFFLFFSVEPALDASIHYLSPWVFINSVIHGMTAEE